MARSGTAQVEISVKPTPFAQATRDAARAMRQVARALVGRTFERQLYDLLDLHWRRALQTHRTIPRYRLIARWRAAREVDRIAAHRNRALWRLRRP